MNKFIQWFKPTFEDDNGTASYRRLTAFVILWLIVYMILTSKVQTSIQLYALYSLQITLLLLIGIVTVQNLITFVKTYKGDKTEEEPKNLKDGDTVIINKEGE